MCVFCFVNLLSILCILCFCVFCAFFPFVYSYLFPIFVQVYRPLPQGRNLIALNSIISYHILSYHKISHHISYHIIPYHIVSHHIIYHIVSYISYIIQHISCHINHIIKHIISYHIVSHHIIYHIYYIVSYIIQHISCHIMSYHTPYHTTYHIISYHIISYHTSYHKEMYVRCPWTEVWIHCKYTYGKREVCSEELSWSKGINITEWKTYRIERRERNNCWIATDIKVNKTKPLRQMWRPALGRKIFDVLKETVPSVFHTEDVGSTSLWHVLVFGAGEHGVTLPKAVIFIRTATRKTLRHSTLHYSTVHYNSTPQYNK